MKKQKEVLFEKLDTYVDILLDQVFIECCGYDQFAEDEINREEELAKSTADRVADIIQPGSNKETIYVMPTRRAPVAAEL